MDTIKVKIGQLRTAFYNPRKALSPKDEEYQKLKRSIEEFGYVVPIVVNKDFTVVGGHQRLTVLKDLGYEEIEVVRIDLDDNDERILNIALNKIQGDWDMEKLEVLFKDLQGSGYDSTLTGFNMDEIDDLVGNFDPLAVEEDSVEEEEEKEKIVVCPSCKFEAAQDEFKS